MDECLQRRRDEFNGPGGSPMAATVPTTWPRRRVSWTSTDLTKWTVSNPKSPKLLGGRWRREQHVHERERPEPHDAVLRVPRWSDLVRVPELTRGQGDRGRWNPTWTTTCSTPATGSVDSGASRLSSGCGSSSGQVHGEHRAVASLALYLDRTGKSSGHEIVHDR